MGWGTTHADPNLKFTDDRGFSLVVVAFGLVITALLVLWVAKATLSSRSGSPSGSPDQQSAAADAIQAQQNLSTALTSVRLAAIDGQATPDAAAIQLGNPALSFTSEASTGPGTISLAATTDGAGAALAARSSDGTCWIIWWTPTDGTWFGAQTGQRSCAAPVLISPPTPTAVTSTSIGWQQGIFPSIGPAHT